MTAGVEVSHHEATKESIFFKVTGEDNADLTLDVPLLKTAVLRDINPIEVLSHERYASYFSTFKKYFQGETSSIQKVVDDFLVKDASVIDIGSGLGDIVPLCSSISSYLAYEENPLLAQKTAETMSGFTWRAKVKNEKFTENTMLANGDADLVIASHSLYGVQNKTQLLKHAMKKLALKGKALIFIRTCSSKKVLEELENEHFCYTTFEMENYASFPSSEDFGQVISLLIGRDLALFPNYLSNLYSLMKAECSSDYISLPTTCIILHHNSFAILEDITPGLLLPGNREYDDFLACVKNKEAQKQRPIGVAMPHTIQEVQAIVRWAFTNNVPLSVVGGGHSEHCSSDSALLISMVHFADVHVDVELQRITFGTGVTAGVITEKAMEHKLAVPLGARPSVGCGMVLQGGIGHFSRLFGLSTHNIVAASVVLINENGDLVTVDECSTEKQEQEILWMTRGAGSNVGVVVSITMRAYPVSSISLTASKMDNLNNPSDELCRYAEFAAQLPKNQSLDLFLYKRDDIMHLNFNGYAILQDLDTHGSTFSNLDKLSNGHMETTVTHNLSPYQLYEVETYMTFPKGNSFKRCVFASKSSIAKISTKLTEWLSKSPSPLSYFHIVHCGGEATRTENSSFGVQQWEFAIVVTGLWNGDLREDVKQWVYDVVDSLLPVCKGVYSVDLGAHEYNDKLLARYAFGANLQKIYNIKQNLDPRNLLNCGCPVIDGHLIFEAEQKRFRPAYPIPDRPKWVIIVCGKRYSGKDYISEEVKQYLKGRSKNVEVASISEETKRMYASESGADFERLCNDREYKEEHRMSLLKYYKWQTTSDPYFNHRQIMQVIAKYSSVDVLIISGMREAEVLNTSQVTLCPTSSIYVSCSNETREKRGWKQTDIDQDSTENTLDRTSNWDYILENEKDGNQEALAMASRIYDEISTIPVYSTEVERVQSQAIGTNNFPSKGIIFTDLLSTSLLNPVVCTSVIDLLYDKLRDTKVTTIIAIESAGFTYGSTLAIKMGLPLILIRKSGKLAPPYYSSCYKGSHVAVKSSQRQHENHELCLSANVLLPGQKVVLLDDVLATGDTILACAELLHQARVDLVKALCLTEFTSHNGKLRLAKYGINVDSIVSVWGK